MRLLLSQLESISCWTQRLFQVVGFWHPVLYVTQSSSALDQLLEIGPPLAGIFIPACLYPSKSSVCSAALPYGDVRCDWPPGGQSYLGSVQLHHLIAHRVYQVSLLDKTLYPAWASCRKLHTLGKRLGIGPDRQTD